MGKIYIDDTEIGTFSPQTYPSSGKAYLNGAEIGIYMFTSENGLMYLNGTEIGSFSGLIPSGEIIEQEVAELLGMVDTVSVVITYVTKYEALPIGIQWGLLVWSASQKKWLRAGTPIT